MRIELADGRVFPCYQGDTLSWDFGMYMTSPEEREGFPRAQRVLSELPAKRLRQEYSSYLRATFDNMFGHNAKKAFALIEREMATRKGESDGNL